MKFMFFFLPSLPTTMDNRRKLRPIAHHDAYWQQMFDEVIELSQMADDLGFAAVAFPEHHLHTEGMEIGSLPLLSQHVIHHTTSIQVGPIGYVLPGWNPLRLALEIAWLDQLSKGRSFVGLARGYQSRWLNQMAQKIHIGATASDQGEVDRHNREAFEEVFQILKLAWGEKPFRFKGKYYEYPSPQEGTPWPAAEWTREYGAPGEVDDQGRVQAIDVVPKPFQKPHPTLFQAFSMSEETVRWCAREGIIPTLLESNPDRVRFFADAYVEEARGAGRDIELGQSLGCFRSMYPAESEAVSRQLAQDGMAGSGFQNFFRHFGFVEAFRFPEDEEKYAGQMLPAAECTIDRLAKGQWCLLGTADDIRRKLDALVENAQPEWLIWQGDQGLLPLAEVKRMMERIGKEVLPHYL